ncbi:TonB-dependent receptor [Chitinophagaceae bacterium LB-8]|uniref:TonB-dependent receptor n=1 Tax=Paraflavisolibacter caeni TaxID=2982496 RepID=A0A9X2XXM4_9BACT|nr:TonB-dependent receptor [Paraflavisolibacter caeni]MCU7550636.1 TonB-dependent receptor [Paraflavisolibacter caeni]
MKKNAVLRSLGFASLLLFSFGAFAQNFPVTGKITGADGQPLAGVTVKVKGSNLAAQTSADGSFQINVPSPDAVLVVSYVGFAEQQVQVANKKQLAVSMVPQQNSLENVVVVGYGTQKKKNVTGAVASLNADNLNERPVSRVDQALVGQLAGVQVKQTSGALGKGMSVQVRGSGSVTAGNEPLYVIDGFPLAQAAPNGSGSFANGNPLDNINPNDIESIQVLKDASAAAIYGSRAANGVVIINTKKGKSGKAKINLNSYVGFSEANRKLDMLSADEWVDRATEMINAQWVASGPGRTASQTNEERRVILGLAPGGVNTSYMTDDRWAQPGHPGLRYIDWQNEAFRKGLVQNHQISASGGNEFVKYYVSGNFADQEGMIKGMDYRSYSARANVEVNASKKLKLGLNLSPTYSITNDPGIEGKDNILHQLVSMTPVQEDSMGLYPNVGNNGQYKWSTSPNSPIGKLEQTIGETKRFRTLTSLFGEYQIIKGLALKSTINFDNTDNTSKGYVPYTISGQLPARQAANYLSLASGSYSTYRRQTFVNENTLSYNKVYNDIHDVSFLAGAAYNSDKFDRSQMNSQNGFGNSVVNTLNAAAAITGNTTETKNVLLSYFGRIQYGFNDKYLFSASIRRDGSSRFGDNTKWGWFPSASAAWRIAEEDFMKGIPQISDLKLRASWGKSGNYNVGDYSAQALLAASNYTFNNAVAFGQAPASVVNPDLSWEKSESFDVGLDIGILRNRVTASLDYYNKLNTDLLLNVPIPGLTGFNSMLSNVGEVRNQGWEIELTSRNLVGKFQWNTSVNFSHNSNKVLALGEGQDQILIPSLFDISHSILKVGEPMNSIYVVRQDGILTQDDISKGAALYGSQTVGDPKYVDANGDGVIDANDRVIVGHPNPNYVWGVTNNLRYKGFDLSVLVQGQSGGSIYSLFGRALGRTGQGFTDNALGFFRDRWRSEADPGAGKVGKAYSTFGRIKNTDWLYPSDYVRVRNITLGYDLGQLFKGKAVSGARIYATAENFFGSDKYKGGFNPEATNTDLSGSGLYPEAGDYGGLPLPKSLILGVNLTF